MIAPAPQCDHENYKKSGKNRNGSQRYKCDDCGVRFSGEAPQRPLGAMRISMEVAEMILRMLVEGMAVRSIERLTNTHRDTICDLILVAGERCQEFHDSNVLNVPVSDVEVDEIWSFVGAKQKTVNARNLSPELGDSWTFTAIERNTKLILAWHVGERGTCDTDRFLTKLRRAVDDTQRYQISSDGLGSYTYGIPFALG